MLLDRADPHIEVKFILLTANQIGNLFWLRIGFLPSVARRLFTNFSALAAVLATKVKTSNHLTVRSREHLGVNKYGKPMVGSFSSVKDHINRTGRPGSLSMIARA